MGNYDLNSGTLLVADVEKKHSIVFLTVINISYPLVLTALEFMCSDCFRVLIQNISQDVLYSTLTPYDQQ